MKRIYMTLSATATLALAIALNSCNNAEEVKKQVEAQNAAIQTQVDDKLNALAEQVNTECGAKVDSLANAAYVTWQEEQAKATKGKKPVAKKPAPAPKKPEPPKPADPKGDKMGGKTQENTQQKGDKMGGQPVNNTDAKAKKMGGGK